MSVSRVVIGMVIAMAVLAGCGGNKSAKSARGTTTPGTSTGVAAGTSPLPSAGGAASASPAPSFPGDPPGSPLTAAMDRAMLQAKIPANVSVIARRDLTNEVAAKDDTELLQQFKDTGRETGVQYVLAIDGTQRISLGINQYATPAQARTEWEKGKPVAQATTAIDVTGIGDEAAGARITLGSGAQQALVNNVTFVRGPYYVTMADFAGDASVSPAPAVSMLRALDTVLRANPAP